MKPKKPKSPDIKTLPVKLMLEIKLTDAELQDYGKQMAQATSELGRKKDYRKSVIAQIDSEVKSVEAKVNALADKINSGIEYRETECTLIYNYKKMLRHTVRIDTGEVVAEQKITPEELQTEIEFQESSK
jgi:hypothetical protein